jgi:hypothetical protein
MRRRGPDLAEKQLPAMDHRAAHVEERGPRALGRRVQREAVAGLLCVVHGDFPYRRNSA